MTLLIQAFIQDICVKGVGVNCVGWIYIYLFNKYMSLTVLKKYSNPSRVFKLTKKYYKTHPPLTCIPKKRHIKGVLIGKLDENAGLYVSTRKNKKYMLFNGCKTIHFGQLPYQDFTKHRNKTRRQNYLKRATNIKGDWNKDAYSPNNLAINLLW